jgi:hypothetical protein
MTKEEVIKQLQESNFKIAQVRVDIASGGAICYPNEVMIVCSDKKYQWNVKPYQGQYCTFESLQDFIDNCVSGYADARKAYCNYYVENFISVEKLDRRYQKFGLVLSHKQQHDF